MAGGAESKLRLSPSLRAPLAAAHRGWPLLAGLAGFLIESLTRALPGMIGGLLGLLASILLWLLIYRVASELLLSEAAGEDARGGPGLLDAPDGLAARHIALWLLATLTLAALSVHWGTAGLLLGGAILAAILPAATIVLTLSRSLIEALVPSRWWQLLTRIGVADYARLAGLLLLAVAAYLLLVWLLPRIGQTGALAGGLITALWATAILAWFHLAGRAVCLHRAELGLDANEPPPEPEPERHTRDPERLWQQIREHGGSEAMHEALARVLEQRGDRARQLEHARLHIPALLLAFEKPAEALRRTARMFELDRDFVIDDVEEMFALLRHAVAAGRAGLVAELTRNYLATWPHSVKTNEARLLACEALAEDGSKARRQAERWFRELMTAELKPEQRERLGRLAGAYLDSARDTGSAPATD
ncbi:MAG: hypothetical protein CVV18_00635 [Gammaproteobacteria bacterium HGW-Gammaproteobacteria-8]|nr:MAG: hypothetical protein CVV18_00635 [Gammaproteobacteria bacterium HGW-Gammaproteobacteria-8]